MKLRDASEGAEEEREGGEQEEDSVVVVGGGGKSGSAGLWLQVDMASVVHHCKVRLEVRVVDGYPWAPAQVRLVTLLGTCPAALKQSIGGLANALLPGGAPLVTGAGGIEGVVRTVYQLLA